MLELTITIQTDEYIDEAFGIEYSHSVTYTKGLNRSGLKELLIKYNNDVMSCDIAEKIIEDIAESMVNGEYYACNMDHLIDSVEKLKHAFHLETTVYKKQNYIEVDYFIDRPVVWQEDGEYGDGYLYVFNSKYGEWIRFDKIVYVVFKGDGLDIKSWDDFDLIHIDGNKLNNELDNLRLVIK